MQEKINKYINDINKLSIKNKEEYTHFKNTFLSKNGILNNLFNQFKSLPNEEKKITGKLLNQLKQLVINKANTLSSNEERITKKENLDLTMPAIYSGIGAEHPLSKVQNRIIEIFNKVGFVISDGPEIEDDWHNFSALNMPEHHPARDMQDTFFITLNPDTLLRTHTSSVQIRYMENNPPPIRIISPGRVYRKEDISARAHCIFHQIEGLYIDSDVNFSDLKKMIMYFVHNLFGKDVKIRFRPSFFPFTEPSAEVDIYWGLNSEADYRITKGTGWLEIMGCGMVDPNVLENVNIDATKFSGFAFGLGIERITMLLHQVDDLRLFYENDIRFLKQFNQIH
ncbi:MAG: phenylalanine--tRNA ligase subunit alpha [Flavobacteriales bacterium]|jgi:phenylalanyl-tRNA synthetase alpha chain|nr:phenylalanine--tRNA ligase subunit alpha [Flavobacteriales bacterium]|tara:strand:- start:5584 stop:6600 length:1017 start_codon:yes stop_codon:yes gene_type:complete